jgi:nucleotide-binding universal stress UspA family protein
LLKLAKAVDVAVATPTTQPNAEGVQFGADIALYLARHGVNVEIIQEAFGADAGRALLLLAAERHSDWMVMGCVAHQRYPGVLLGGATSVVLNEASIPVLMSH